MASPFLNHIVIICWFINQLISRLILISCTTRRIWLFWHIGFPYSCTVSIPTFFSVTVTNHIFCLSLPLLRIINLPRLRIFFRAEIGILLASVRVTVCPYHVLSSFIHIMCPGRCFLGKSIFFLPAMPGFPERSCINCPVLLRHPIIP